MYIFVSCRCINVLVGWVKNVLSNEQKKVDFKPERDVGLIANCTPVSDPSLTVYQCVPLFS